MKKSLNAVLTAAFLAFLTPIAANAADITKSDVTRALSGKGYAVQEFNSNGVQVNVGGYVVLVFVAGSDKDVSFVHFVSGVTGNELSYEFLNSFNNDVKFGRAYIDGDGDVALQMDRNASGGISIQNVESDFEVFLTLINKFLSDLESQAVV